MPSTTSGGGGGKRSRSFGGGRSSNSANQSGSSGSSGAQQPPQLNIHVGKPSRLGSLSLAAARRQRASASASTSAGASLRRKRPSSATSGSAAVAAAGRGASASASAASSSHAANATDDHQARLESLTLHLSSLEAQRDAKRMRLQSLGEQMQSIRSTMRHLEEELQGLDGAIDGAEGQVRRLARAAATGGDDGRGGGAPDGDVGSGQTQTLQYASTQLSPTQQEARPTQEEEEGHERADRSYSSSGTRKSKCGDGYGGGGSANGYVGSTQDVGTQDMNDNEEEEVVEAEAAALTMNPDEVLTELPPPTQEVQSTRPSKSKAAGASVSASASAVAAYAPRDDDDEMDMIAGHYDDDFGGEEYLEDMSEIPPPEDDFDHRGGEEASASAAFGAHGGYSTATAAGASAGAGRASSADYSYAFDATTSGRSAGAEVRPGSSDSDVIDLGTVYRADPPAAMVPSGGNSNFGTASHDTSGGGSGGSTLDSYFSRTANGTVGGRQQSAASRGTASDGGILAHATSAANFDAPAASFSLSNSDRPTREDRNASYMHRLARDSFRWSREMDHHLQNTFRIQSFRENQKEVINATMSGDDVMVLMRTGGGKSEFSLTCQRVPMSG